MAAAFNTFTVLKPMLKETYPGKRMKRVKIAKPIKIAQPTPPKGFK